MPATSETSRNRTPLSPRVTTARRGGHVATRSAPVQEQVLESPVARGVRVSPNAIIAPRGRVARRSSAPAFSLRSERRFAIR